MLEGIIYKEIRGIVTNVEQHKNVPLYGDVTICELTKKDGKKVLGYIPQNKGFNFVNGTPIKIYVPRISLDQIKWHLEVLAEDCMGGIDKFPTLKIKKYALC